MTVMLNQERLVGAAFASYGVLADRAISAGPSNDGVLALTPFGGHRAMRLEGLPRGGCSVASRR